MRTGVIFPQTEIGVDPGAIRTYASTAQALGFHHLIAYDHVLGADPAVYPGWSGPYDIDTTFHEPFVLFGYLAAMTEMELVTSIIILPQRQTALVAKQAAEIDVLTGGRFRLGVGLGWNAVEYEALGKEFSNRGRRSAEQIALLRQLFTERSVTFEGEFEQVRGAGLAPMPVQQPIPIWLGANSPLAWKRVGELADGWFPQQQPGAGLEEAKAIVDAAATEAGRVPAAIGLEGRLTLDNETLSSLPDAVQKWEAAGASHVSFNTMRLGLTGVEDHLKALAAAAEALGLRA